MAIDISTLTDVERQELVDALHKRKIFPSTLIGTGSPAHVQAVIANLNDLRGMVFAQNTVVARLFDALTPAKDNEQT